MSNKGWEDAVGKTWDQFFEEAQNTWKTVYDLNHGFIDPDAKERAEIEARFEALEARVEALENKTTTDTGEFIEPSEEAQRDEAYRDMFSTVLGYLSDMFSVDSEFHDVESRKQILQTNTAALIYNLIEDGWTFTKNDVTLGEPL